MTSRVASDLPHDLRQDFDQIVDRFVNSWKQGQRPDIANFLPSDNPLRLAVLRKLVHVDLERRYSSGEQPGTDEYLNGFPELKAASGFVESLDGAIDRLKAAHVSADSNPTIEDNQNRAAESDNTLPERIGRYQVERILGKGGFGLVFLAFDEKLQRHVAVKVPHSKLLSGPEDAELYLTEARTVARLDHPHIVAVHDVGSTEQFPCYVVSKYIDGTDLSSRIKQSRLSIHEAVELVATVAEALHYAHTRGLVHRDIKPGNILIDKSGTAFVVDFGLALREQNLGKGPRFVGTTAYMSPEQARGEGHRVDGRSDIFSLAVVFYELLVGRRPFSGHLQAELLDQIISHEPRPLRQLDDNIPKELDRICLKALSKRASERYSAAKDMADDLRHFLTQYKGYTGTTTSIVSLPNQQVIEPPSTVKGAETPIPPSSDNKPIKIVPKGLRSFDAHDAEFFLELLPGPRDRDGLPDGLRFWKTRIEETDPDNTFSVGLIYGPSGCGKSSLVKAGLEPLLPQNVIAAYVEATAEDTETRLLNGLRKRCPAAPDNLSLKQTLAVLRRGQGIPYGKKVLIILDQFEQWLHAKKQEQNTELVEALRQCDGGRLQCIVMVRVDFWMAATRFMRELEVKLLEGQNSAAVDLFDIDHARRVLTAFGQAFGRLPEIGGHTSKDQKEFLNRAVSGLAEEGKVISVRLALFAEMMKGKPWTPATLKEVGGTEGVGGTFLEETFSAATAPPEHRYHQKAARAVLKSLLPESGTDIKGHMRSRAHLLEASGYQSRPKDFDDLIRILDTEVRLITPTDPEGHEESSASSLEAREKYFQLTHDYLVPSLREWLTQKEKETSPGRAKLLLEEHVAVWNARPENRHLPSLKQWIQIRRWTQKKNWTPLQRKMMSRAGKYHAVRGTVIGLLLMVITFTTLVIRKHLNEQERAIHELAVRLHAEKLVGRVIDVNTTEVPAIIQQILNYKEWAEPLLRQEKEKSVNDPRKQLHASLALLPWDAGQKDYLYDRLLKAEPQEVVVIRDALFSHKADLIKQLWTLLENRTNDQDQRFRAACALARFAPDDPRWKKNGSDVASMLVTQTPFEISHWTEALNGIGHSLLAPLADILFDEKRNLSERGLTASIYGKYAANNPEAYTRLEKRLAETREESDSIAQRQASLGVALLIMGHGDNVWSLLKHSPDPTRRGYVIDRFQKMGVDPKVIMSRLAEEQEVSIKRALLLSLGEYRQDRLSVDNRTKLQLMQFYREEADSGIHGAVEWLLRQWGETLPKLPIGEPILTVEQKARIASLDAEIEEIRQRIKEGSLKLERQFREQSAALPAFLRDKLVAHYQFDETNGSETVNAVTGRPGGVYSGPGRYEGLPGVHGQAVRLTTKGGHFNCGNVFSPERTDSFSCGCWFLADTKSGRGVLLGKFDDLQQRGFAVNVEPATDLVICEWSHHWPDNSLFVTGRVPELGRKWHHLLVTYDGSSTPEGVNVYMDGRLVKMTADWNCLSESIQTSVPFQIGLRDRTFPFQGAIDDVRIYDRCLGEEEVLQLYESGLRALASIIPEIRTTEQQALLEAGCVFLDKPLERLENQFSVFTKALNNANLNAIRGWYVNGQGQTMVIIPKPGDFWMGQGDAMHQTPIDHNFAIGSKEVTVEQYRHFPRGSHTQPPSSLTRDCPAASVSWYEAAAYCNWLSEQEGIPRDQWCYEPTKAGTYEAGMVIPSDFLRRTGYRLPTEAEWEYACRGGADTKYSFGDSEELVVKYCWCSANSLDRTHPVGALRANDFGLFDMHGNIWEWCQNVLDEKAKQAENDVVKDEDSRALRGGSYFDPSSFLHSGKRHKDEPCDRGQDIGFRLARTLPIVPVTPFSTPKERNPKNTQTSEWGHEGWSQTN